MAAKNTASETPLMRQYAQIKAKYPGALLLFRVGDFYETFGEDAVTTSRILGIVLTKRGAGSPSEIELAGFPHHSLDNYLPRLVRAGQRVAICDQLEDPKMTKNIVKRGVTELVTPGVSYNDKVLDTHRNNYLAAVHFDNGNFGIAFLDISTGEFMVAQGQADYADKLLQGFRPSEVLVCKAFRADFQKIFGDKLYHYAVDDWVYGYDYAYEKLTSHFGTKSLKGFGVEKLNLGIIAAGACLHYLEATHHSDIVHINAISRLEEEKYVWLDRFTIRNLELMQPSHEGGKCLLDILDKTITPMGARLLRKWTVLPLKEQTEIEKRLQVVEYFLEHKEVMNQVQQSLSLVGDLERLVSKAALKRINPREVVQLRRSLEAILPIKELFAAGDNKDLQLIAEQISPCLPLIEKIRQEIQEEAPALIHKGGIIRPGVNADLDELSNIAFHGKDYLADLQKRESERTGISSLKVAFNNVFGYYLEVTHAHKDKVPAEWIRKQTLVNAERYITEELKVYEEKILGAEDRIREIENRIYEELIHFIADYVAPIQQNSQLLARTDCLLSFARLAAERNYTRPELNQGYELSLQDVRHPVIEQQLKPGEEYIPNDLYLNNGSQQEIILTGPNMSGKSAILRQTALAVLMAQMGSFVAARKAVIGIVDKIFTRVGASDNISSGESTFMVEMMETASILNNLSDRSLVLLDEIGRGTSTYDGVSLAWSIAEYLFQHKTKPKTLFATHYHELNELEAKNEGIVNYHVAVKESDNNVLFLRKMKPGGSEHSFGIHVARMAGVPAKVLARANDILVRLETDRAMISGKDTMKKIPEVSFQMQMFQLDDPKLKQLREKIENINPDALTPIEALMKINELKILLEN